MVVVIAPLLVALHGGELHTNQPTGMLALLGLVVVVAAATFFLRRSRSGQRTP